MIKMNSKISDIKDNQSFIAELKKIPFLKNFNITLNNTNDFIQAYTENENCNKCKSIANCLNPSEGYFTKIIEEKNGYNFVLCQCKYKKKLAREQELKKIVKTLYISNSIMDADLKSFDVSNNQREKIYNYLTNFSKNFSEENYMKGLIISGPVSTGKTYALACLANELANRDIKSLLVYFPDLVRDLKSSLSTTRFDELLNAVKNVDVLMLDDLGSEMMTSWVRDEILGPIVNFRLMEKKPVFISTNLSSQESFVSYLSETKNESDKLKAIRIYDRLKALCLISNLSEKKFER